MTPSGERRPAAGPRPRNRGVEAEITGRLRAAGCVFAEDEAHLLIAAARGPAELGSMVDRRIEGLPLEQVIGWADFCGLRIAVDPGVFVPRHRSTFLVTRAASLGRRGAVLLDLCCGSGAIGAAVAARLGEAELHAADIDPVAVGCARRNVGGAGRVYEGDLYDPLPATLRGRVDLLVCNAPYVPTDAVATLPREARLYEPRVALDGGHDGLDLQRRVVRDAPRWLAPGGHLLVETSARQAAQSAALCTAAGLRTRVVYSDALESTVVLARAGNGS